MIGIDILEISRVKLDETLLETLFLPSEREYIRSFKTLQGQKERVAGFVCAKEAVMKALELGEGSGVRFLDIEICHKPNGAPYVKLYGVAKSAKKQVEISISHSKTVATAIAKVV